MTSVTWRFDISANVAVLYVFGDLLNKGLVEWDLTSVSLPTFKGTVSDSEWSYIH